MSNPGEQGNGLICLNIIKTRVLGKFFVPCQVKLGLLLYICKLYKCNYGNLKQQIRRFISEPIV